MNALRQRRRGGLADQPTAPATVLLASTNGPFSPAAIRLAGKTAGRTPVAVVVITRIHGYALGIPNPGLLPTRKEQDAAAEAVADAVRALKKLGITADGQVAATRNSGKTLARIARVRNVRHVVLDNPSEGGRLRRLIEGDPAAGLRRRLDPAVELHRVPADA